MASDDIYLRKDVYEADQRAAKAESALRDNEILKAIERLRIEVNGKIEELRIETNKKIDDFRTEVNDRFNQVDKRIDKLESRVDVLSGHMDLFEKRMDSFEGRLDSIQTYVGLGIAFITIIITLYTFLAPVMKAAKNFLERFGNEAKRDSSQGLTAEQVREIFRSEAEEIISSKLKALR